jgi:predicted transcriptional regulator of viral defense system
MRELERVLDTYPSRIIEHATLSSILENLAYKRINDKIVKLKNKDILTPLKSGLYVYNPLYNNTLLSKEIIANILLGPSCVSLDFAIWFHGLIPESVHEITSITTKRSKSFETHYGVFSYVLIKKELFNIGLEIKTSKSGNFIMASKEKALCDKVYFTKDIDLRSQKAMREFLEDDLRIDMDELENCDIKIFEEYTKVSKSKKIEVLTKVIKGLSR